MARAYRASVSLVLLLHLLTSAQLCNCTHYRSTLQYEEPPGGQPDQAAAAAASTAPNSTTGDLGSVNLTLVVDAVRKAINEPVPYMFNFKTEFEANGSSISVAESYASNTLAVQFRFGACTGAQLHHHSTVEFMQGVSGSLHVGIFNPSGTLVPFNMTAGLAVVIPSGYVHYYLNMWCDPAVLVATWPAGTKTIFELPILSAIPATRMSSIFSASGAAPTPKPGFPLIQDPDCLQRCSGNWSAAAGRAVAKPAQGP